MSYWIKLEHTTPDKPEVHAMASFLDMEPNTVLGGLVRVFVWADQQADESCNAYGVTKALLDHISRIPRFGEAMHKAGWIRETEDGLAFVNFDRHNGGGAKRRAQTASRVSKVRNKPCNAPSVTTALPEEEEEKKKSNTNTNTRRFRAPSVEEVREYCESRQSPVDPEAFVDFYESVGWKVGSKPMKEWKRAVHTWERRQRDGGTGGKPRPVQILTPERAEQSARGYKDSFKWNDDGTPDI